MVFGFEKFICDEVIKNYDTKEKIHVVFFNIGLLISVMSSFFSSLFNLVFFFINRILFFVFEIFMIEKNRFSPMKNQIQQKFFLIDDGKTFLRV